MNKEIKVGDIVQLKSGGLKMTVGGFHNPQKKGAVTLADCYWSVGGGMDKEIRHGEIPVNALEKVGK